MTIMKLLVNDKITASIRATQMSLKQYLKRYK